MIRSGDLRLGHAARKPVGDRESAVEPDARLPHERLDDNQLVELFRSGHEEAFNVLVARYRPPLVAYCSRFVDPDQAEDVAQFAFESAWALLRDPKREAIIGPWLYRVAHNRAIAVLRKTKGRSVALIRDIDSGEAGPHDTIEQEEKLLSLLNGLTDLPPRQRKAIMLRALDGRSYDEIAHTLDVTPVNARKLVQLARKRLRSGVSALLPLFSPLTRWFGGGASSGQRALELAAGTGGGGVAVKLIAGLVVLGSLVGGSLELNGNSAPDRRGDFARKAAAERSLPGPATTSASQANRAGEATLGSSVVARIGKQPPGAGRREQLSPGQGSLDPLLQQVAHRGGQPVAVAASAISGSAVPFGPIGQPAAQAGVPQLSLFERFQATRENVVLLQQPVIEQRAVVRGERAKTRELRQTLVAPARQRALERRRELADQRRQLKEADGGDRPAQLELVRAKRRELADARREMRDRQRQVHERQRAAMQEQRARADLQKRVFEEKVKARQLRLQMRQERLARLQERRAQLQQRKEQLRQQRAQQRAQRLAQLEQRRAELQQRRAQLKAQRQAQREARRQARLERLAGASG